MRDRAMAHHETNPPENDGDGATTDARVGADPLASAEQDAEREAAALTADAAPGGRTPESDGPRNSRARAKSVDASASVDAGASTGTTPSTRARSASARATAE